jgi:hypothetical protein
MQGIFTKLERAHRHLELFESEVRTYIQRNPLEFEGRLYRKGQLEYDFVVSLRIHEYPPSNLSSIAGELLHNMRCCLDHLAHQLSTTRSAYISDQDMRAIEFPISDSSCDFIGSDGNGRPTNTGGLYKIRFMQPAVQGIIKRLQPYQRGPTAHLHPLWLLHELCSIDRYRHLVVPAVPPDGFSLRSGNYQVKSHQHFVSRPLKDGSVVLKAHIVALEGYEGRVRFKSSIPKHVALEKVSDTTQKHAVKIAKEILEFIEDEVISVLMPFLN